MKVKLDVKAMCWENENLYASDYCPKCEAIRTINLSWPMEKRNYTMADYVKGMKNFYQGAEDEWSSHCTECKYTFEGFEIISPLERLSNRYENIS